MEVTTEKVPCSECICLPSCRHKSLHAFIKTVANCPFIVTYLRFLKNDEKDEKIDQILEILRISNNENS
jgi:disulfide oxidoreductase YuzD